MGLLVQQKKYFKGEKIKTKMYKKIVVIMEKSKTDINSTQGFRIIKIFFN